MSPLTGLEDHSGGHLPLDLLPPPSPILSCRSRGVKAVPSGGGYLQVSRLNKLSGLHLAWGASMLWGVGAYKWITPMHPPLCSSAHKMLMVQSLW